jgi:lipopolysaccharide transport system permease protein
VRDFEYFRDLLTVLVSKELRLRYRGTTFGIIWSLANPVVFALVLYVAFRKVFQVDIAHYPLFILTALFPWQWLSNSLNASSLLFISNSALIKKLPFPTFALCAAVVVTDMVHFLVTIPVIGVVRWLSLGEGPPVIWLVGVPLLLIVQSVTLFGAVMVIATWNAFLRDLEQLIRVTLLLLFYVTPILFPVSMVPESLHWLLVVNPVGPLVIAWRSLLADGLLGPYVLVAAAYGVGALLIAVPVYRSMSWRLAEVV